VVWISNVIGDTLNDAKQMMDEVVVHQGDVVRAQAFHTRHLIHELQQQLMEARVILSPPIDQLEEAREASLVDHARKQGFLAVSI
jgi:hypothetical protein